MAQKFMKIVLTPEVQASQDHYLGQHHVMDAVPKADLLTESEMSFIAARDSFYMATRNSDGWPYVQHRGGPRGFLKVLSPSRLAFVDLQGNRQLLTVGNLAGDDRVSLMLVDYPQRERLKILGHARVVDVLDQPELIDEFNDVPELRSRVERIFLIEIVGYDWNCPKYITPRYTRAEVQEMIVPLQLRITELEAKLEGSRTS